MTGACERQFSPETGDLLAVCVAGADAHARPFMWDGKTLRMSHVRLVGAPGLSSGVTMRCPALHERVELQAGVAEQRGACAVSCAALC